MKISFPLISGLVLAFAGAVAGAPWTAVYEARLSPPGEPWVRDAGSERVLDKMADGALLIADRGSERGDYLYYRYAWQTVPEGRTVAEASLKLESGWSAIILNNGANSERLIIRPDRIELFHNPRLRHSLDTTAGFRTYRIEAEGSDILVYVDGELCIDGSGAFTAPAYQSVIGSVSFGGSSGPELGEAYWKAFRVKAPEKQTRDIPPMPAGWSRDIRPDVPLVRRDDGFGQFYREPPMTREILEREYVDYLRGTGVDVLEWGIGPGETFTFDTKAGEIFLGHGLSEEQLRMVRRGDRWVYENVKGLISAGHCPFEVAVRRGHEIGLEVWGRWEMNHAFGPAREDNWMWVAFSSTFLRENPQYRIGDSARLDYKHQAVRDFRLEVLREIAEKGADGLSLDFVVYPPHFENPAGDHPLMTRFIRDVRAMADEVGKEQGRYIRIIVRVPYADLSGMGNHRVPEPGTGPADQFSSIPQGLDWRSWIDEGLVDIIIPSAVRTAFDVPLHAFVEAARGTDVRIYGCIRGPLDSICTDAEPGEEEEGIRRYRRPKTNEMHNAQAMLLLRDGADGIQMALSENWWRQSFDDHGRMSELRYRDKDYLADAACPVTLERQLPASFPGDREKSVAVERRIVLRVADDIEGAMEEGYGIDAALVMFCRPLYEGERLEVLVNGTGRLDLGADDFPDMRGDADPIDPRAGFSRQVFMPDWWKAGMRVFRVPVEWWRFGNNVIKIRYTGQLPENTSFFRITDMNLMLSYSKD